MANTICIAPSILSADFARLGEQVRDAETGGADLIHIDVMDGRFVPNLSFGPLIVDAVRRSTALPLDVHLMILEPDDYLAEFAKAGATAISVHWEACPHLHRSLQRIRDLGCRAGIAINPHTPASLLSEIMHLLDVIIVMTVNPGFGGQSFLPETLPKVGQLRQMITASGRDIALEVDGGINTSTALQAVQAGANVLIAGNGIFNRNHSIQTGIEALRAAARRQ